MIKKLNQYMFFAVVFSVFSTFSVSASEWQKYDKDQFMASQKSGDKILVDIFATWCTTCKAQSVIMNKMRAAGELDGVSLYKVDYDVNKEFVKEYRIARQSTILVFHGKEEKVRSIAETNPERLTAVIASALK